jgi:GcrA cell cycle regulator
MSRGESPWDDARIARLRALWAEGHSMSEIGRCMGMSKNTIVAKVHRLNLPSRPSPIRAGGVATALQRDRIVKAPPLVAVALEPQLGDAARAFGPCLRPALPREARFACVWPVGTPGTPQFRFCNADTGDSVYCPRHHAIAFLPA